MEDKERGITVRIRFRSNASSHTCSRQDMRVLNSGRRWGNDVPTSLDLSRDIDVLGVQVGDRSVKQLQIGRRLATLEAQLKQVTYRIKLIPRKTCMRGKY